MSSVKFLQAPADAKGRKTWEQTTGTDRRPHLPLDLDRCRIY